MTNHDLIRALARVWPPWHGRDFTGDFLPYSAMSDLAMWLDQAFTNGAYLDAVPAVFDLIEDTLAREEPELKYLITAGLFESLQTYAVMNFEPPDVVDDYLGLRSLELWRGVIEGFSKPGIRSIAALRELRRT